MRMTEKSVFAVSALAFAMGVRAAVSGVSGTVSVDTRFQANSLTTADQACDTRSVTLDWSQAVKVDTRTPLGTMIIVR